MDLGEWGADSSTAKEGWCVCRSDPEVVNILLAADILANKDSKVK